MNLNVKDEILTGEPKYKIKQNDTTLYDNVTIEMITPVQQQGTPINKDLLDEIQGAKNKTTTFNADGSITETTQNVTKTTTFNTDGTITETCNSTLYGNITKTTTFNADGSITETIS